MPVKSKRFTVEDLWKIERLGGLSLSPDGAQAVCAVSRYSMQDNKSASSLYLLSTFGGKARLLTSCGEKDGHARWSPRGDLIAFVAKRDQQGVKDEQAQLYVIAPDGGEARRITQLPTGVSDIKWFPDGKRIAFISWVWPDLRGQKAQAAQLKAFRERKESAYVTEEHQYRYWDQNLPMGREAHLHVVQLDTGKITNLFEGSAYTLSRAEPDATMFDIAPDGKRVVFCFDPEPVKRSVNNFALAQLEVKSGKFKLLARDAAWDLSGPRFDHTGSRIACVARHSGPRHTAPAQLALMDAATGKWQLLSAKWDREVGSHLAWATDEDAIFFAGEDDARKHLWKFDLRTRTPSVIAQGGWVHGFDVAAGTIAWAADSMTHPVRLYAQQTDAGAQRLETFNDKLLSAFKFGAYESVKYRGAAAVKDASGKAQDSQMWVVYPPDFDAKKDAKKKYPLLHSIHGGPHTAAGDTWHYRWNNQLFASGNGMQDYVVVCVNYHGSTSFGFKFKDAITHRWGELELQDVERATDQMLKQPFIDRERVFATGGSYGGYMVSWMNGHVKKDRYKAYVCHAGCTDWVGMFASDGAEWFKQELGAWYWDDMAKVHSQSPHAFAKRYCTPTLVIHGQLDYRVPDAQGLGYYNTLKTQNVDARLVWFPDENHWILKPRNSKLWYGEFFNWLARYDPVRKAKK